METKKVLLWWFLYNLFGTLAGAGIGLVGGFFGGFFAAILGSPAGFEGLLMIAIITVSYTHLTLPTIYSV